VAKKAKVISEDKAKALLWEAGELSWKLRGCQHEIRKGILESEDKIQTIVAGRRTGKTFTLCVMVLELCLKKPNSIVKYACPIQKMVSTIIMPIIREITDDCPKHLKPEWKAADKKYVFPNGSEIHIAGTDAKNAENLRGTAADFAVLDEAGFMSDLKYVVRTILSPTLKTRNGKMILASTPSRSANHEFVEFFMVPMQVAGKLKVYTIHDNPNFDDDTKEEIRLEYPLLEKDPEYRREYLCELPDSIENSILPSFTPDRMKDIITEDLKMPAFCHKYVSLDPGGTDLTAILFGYYDFEQATLCVVDEIICDGGTNTEVLAQLIKEKEKLHWSHPIDKTPMPPFKRVSDVNNQILLTDLYALHGLLFTKSKKDKRDAALNALDVDIVRGNIKIHPRCKTLIYHMRYAEWNNARTDFKHLKDSVIGELRGGHADALAALLYLHRSVVKNLNPFPAGFGHEYNPNQFNSLHAQEAPKSAFAKHLTGLFKKK